MSYYFRIIPRYLESQNHLNLAYSRRRRNQLEQLEEVTHHYH